MNYFIYISQVLITKIIGEKNMGNIKLDVATNFDTKILDYIKQKDTNHQVVSLFGKLKTDIIGGGRSSISLKDVSLEEVYKYNIECKNMGIRLNYLLNPLCLGNKDVISVEHNKIVSYIKELYDMGIEWVTVCSPYLLNIIKNQFPNMKVTIGLYAFINTLQEAQNWVDMGADELTLLQSYTRDFEMLKKYLICFKNKDINLRILANNGCLHECPFSVNHGSAAAHSSANNEESTKKYLDYSLVNCYQRKILKPANILASDWIRPEDLRYYEELCEETGNDRLVIKLVERTKSTDFLCNVIGAYIDEKYDGNLLDLFNWIGNNEEGSNLDINGYAKSLAKGELNLEEFKKYSDFFQIPKIILDNNLLDGFISHFKNNYQCREKICWMNNEEPDEQNPNYCYYCHNWAKKAIKIQDKDYYEKWKSNVNELKEGFDSSKIFN